MDELDLPKHCPCIATNHAHKPGQCDEPAPPQGNGQVCPTCRYWNTREGR
jgi:hypothetical protein